MPLIEITTDQDVLHPTPIRFAAPAGQVLPSGGLQLREEGGSRRVAAQRDGDYVVAILSGLSPRQRLRFHLEGSSAGSGVTLREEGPHALAILLPEGHFSTYNFAPEVARPFFHPVLGPGGKMVTRSFPMKTDVPGEARDHPHHRSFWTAYDEVNGVDNWSEAAGKHGWTRHQKFESRTEGPVFGGFTAAGTWQSREGKPVLDERRTIRVYNVGPEQRLLDYEVQLAASYEDVEYGDTKEGGIMAFRVASTMDGKAGGRIENSLGGVTEKQCWGKRAAWLDYSGPVDGQIYGIGMMDHPGNLNHPCYWHARDYGLVGLNPFAKAAFEGGAKRPWHQKKGEALRFRYRVLIHRGNAREGRMEEAYHAWIQTPTVRPVG